MQTQTYTDTRNYAGPDAAGNIWMVAQSDQPVTVDGADVLPWDVLFFATSYSLPLHMVIDSYPVESDAVAACLEHCLYLV